MANLDIEYIILRKVQEYPFIYKKNLPEYMVHTSEDDAWDEIAAYVARVKHLPAFTGSR